MKLSTTIAALVLALLTVPALARAASPAPGPTPNVKLPNKPMHSWFSVEVNGRGQVVRIKDGELSKDQIFDTMTVGNVLQMWIRLPDGSAQVGLFRVSYSYDPHTRTVARHVSLISSGGTWGDDPGAATKMVDVVHREAQAAQARLKAEQQARQAEAGKHLPDINAAVKKAQSTASPSPQP